MSSRTIIREKENLTKNVVAPVIRHLNYFQDEPCYSCNPKGDTTYEWFITVCRYCKTKTAAMDELGLSTAGKWDKQQTK